MLTVLLVALAGCRTGQQRGAELPQYDLPARRAAAVQSFERAALFKPSPSSDFADALVYAPIIVRQAADEAGAAIAMAYAGESTAELLGAAYRQWVYSWSEETAGGPSFATYWLRITVDDSGFPLVWETLDAGCARVEVYVSQALADRAAARWGPAKELNRLAIEHLAPGPACCAVIRVLSDGPAPMGPFVYIGADRRIAAVICRCMPSQVNHITTAAEYALMGAEAAIGDGVLPSVETAFLPGNLRDSCPFSEQLAEPAFLEKALRWPGGI